MVKNPPSRARTKPRTPTTKNGKFVITFTVLGTPVQNPETKTIQIKKNEIFFIELNRK